MVPVYWEQIIVRGTELHISFDFEVLTNIYRMTHTSVCTYVNTHLDFYPFFRSLISVCLQNYYIDRHTRSSLHFSFSTLDFKF
jgi:hypothetical protein